MAEREGDCGLGCRPWRGGDVRAMLHDHAKVSNLLREAAGCPPAYLRSWFVGRQKHFRIAAQ